LVILRAKMKKKKKKKKFPNKRPAKARGKSHKPPRSGNTQNRVRLKVSWWGGRAIILKGMREATIGHLGNQNSKTPLVTAPEKLQKKN
jgi:hypothetical protein